MYVCIGILSQEEKVWQTYIKNSNNRCLFVDYLNYISLYENKIKLVLNTFQKIHIRSFTMCVNEDWLSRNLRYVVLDIQPIDKQDILDIILQIFIYYEENF